jgi:hypothetical protein
MESVFSNHVSAACPPGRRFYSYNQQCGPGLVFPIYHNLGPVTWSRSSIIGTGCFCWAQELIREKGMGVADYAAKEAAMVDQICRMVCGAR